MIKTGNVKWIEWSLEVTPDFFSRKCETYEIHSLVLKEILPNLLDSGKVKPKKEDIHCKDLIKDKTEVFCTEPNFKLWKILELQGFFLSFKPKFRCRKDTLCPKWRIELTKPRTHKKIDRRSKIGKWHSCQFLTETWIWKVWIWTYEFKANLVWNIWNSTITKNGFCFFWQYFFGGAYDLRKKVDTFKT